MDLALIALATFVRDLLEYDESLMQIGRDNDDMANWDAGYIVIDSPVDRQALSSSRSYVGSTEVMTYTKAERINATIDFFGEAAYTNANRFAMLMKTQRRIDTQKELGLTVYSPSSLTNVKLLAGSQYKQRYQIAIAVTYNHALATPVKRIDTADVTFTTNN